MRVAGHYLEDHTCTWADLMVGGMASQASGNGGPVVLLTIERKDRARCVEVRLDSLEVDRLVELLTQMKRSWISERAS